MPTPTQSTVNRGPSDTEAQLRDVIFENEKLKIQVQALREKLSGTGLQHVKVLRHENATLKSQLDSVKVQLEEKTAQLDLLRNSDARFSTIGDSLQDLLKQVREQKAQLEAMQHQASDKDKRIEKLEEQLEMKEADLVSAQSAAKEMNDSGAAEALEAVKHELADKEAAWIVELHRANEHAEDIERALAEARAQCATLDKQLTEARAEKEHAVAAAAAAAAVSAPCVQCEERRQVCEQLKMQLKAQEALVARAQAEAESARDAPAAAAASPSAAPTATFDPSSKEAKAFVEKKIQEALQDRERRLQILIDQNASLLSRLSLVQDTQGMVKKLPQPPQPEPQRPPQPSLQQQEQQQAQQWMKLAALAKANKAPRQASSASPDEFKSRRKDARSAVERRFEAMLRNDVISKEDVQLLLQEVLDYQEKIDLDTQTQLYIKDLQMDDAAKEMNFHLERLENENRTLTKEFQREAFHELLRGRRGSNAAGDGADTAAVSPNFGTTSGERRRVAEQSGDHGNWTTPPITYEAALRMENPWGSSSPPAGAAQRSGGGGTPMRHVDPSPAHAHPHGLADSPNYTLPRPGSGGAAAGANASSGFQVNCPACTFKQPYGDGKCQLCETSLPSPALQH